MMSTSTHAAGAAVEDLSRMEGEYGAKMIGRLKQLDVLIIGMKGLGVEVAKNLILAGPRSVTVHDDAPANIADLGSNFFLHENMIGQPRAQAIVAALGELNPNVNVRSHHGSIDAALIHKFDCVCVTSNEYPLHELIAWDEACRSKPHQAAAFVMSSASGASGYVFADFGPSHLCFDADGVPARSVVIDHVSLAEHGVVTIDGDRHLLNDGDHVKIEEVRGMNDSPMETDDNDHDHDEHVVGFNDKVTTINATFEIRTTKNPKRFLIGDTRGLREYEGGGVGLQVKQQVTFNHSSLSSQLRQPTLIPGYMDFTKFGRDTQLHLATLAIWQFQEQNSRLPALHSQSDANEILRLARSTAAEIKEGPLTGVEVDESVIRAVSLYAVTELSPICALFGGIVAQEITKVAGKYTPITQFFHFDAFEILDSQPPVDAQPQQSRYDHQISIFGAARQALIESQRVFLVGAGALGCEFMKAFALMGLGCSDNGEILVTDDDRIELSNLSRQFLFRRKHVGLAKSLSAGEAAIEMNPRLAKSLKALEQRVEPKSENVFDDKFWDSLSFVVNAVDNQTARKYTDGKCVLHEKPLFESGTLGTQANSVVCLPHLTPSYSEGAVAGEEQGIAKCTLRNFPSDIVHCIEWSREKFDDLFVSGADLANSFIQDRNSFFAKLKQDPLTEADALKNVHSWLNLSANPSFDRCVETILQDFVLNFRNSINDLTHAFPRDARIVERETGVDLGPFWHGHKRFPSAITFDAQNPEHVAYVYHGANILASVFGLPEQNQSTVAAIAAKLSNQISPWKYTGARVDMSGDDKDAGKAADEAKAIDNSLSEEDSEAIERLTQELSSMNLSIFHNLTPAEFEKDNDRNHHVDFLTASANLRAFNYQIKPATRTKVRLVAGKIIPAIATTTATITGFIGLELLKHIKDTPLETRRAATINLATNVFCCESLPDPVRKTTGMDPSTYMPIVAIPEGHTIWDKVIVNKPGLTLGQLLETIKEQHHGVVIEMLATPAGVVFYNGMDMLMGGVKATAMKQRLNMDVVKLHEMLVGPIVPESRNYILFDSTSETDSGDSGAIPIIKYIFK